MASDIGSLPLGLFASYLVLFSPNPICSVGPLKLGNTGLVHLDAMGSHVKQSGKRPGRIVQRTCIPHQDS